MWKEAKTKHDKKLLEIVATGNLRAKKSRRNWPNGGIMLPGGGPLQPGGGGGKPPGGGPWLGGMGMPGGGGGILPCGGPPVTCGWLSLGGAADQQWQSYEQCVEKINKSIFLSYQYYITFIKKELTTERSPVVFSRCWNKSMNDPEQTMSGSAFQITAVLNWQLFVAFLTAVWA